MKENVKEKVNWKQNLTWTQLVEQVYFFVSFAAASECMLTLLVHLDDVRVLA